MLANLDFTVWSLPHVHCACKSACYLITPWPWNADGDPCARAAQFAIFLGGTALRFLRNYMRRMLGNASIATTLPFLSIHAFDLFSLIPYYPCLTAVWVGWYPSSAHICLSFGVACTVSHHGYSTGVTFRLVAQT